MIFLAYGIKCWKCTSEFPYTFCNDPFNATAHHKRWAYDECTLPESVSSEERNLTATCRKLKLHSRYYVAFALN